MCWWSMTWPMPISSTMAGKRRQLCRYRVHAMWQSFTLSKSYNMAGWRIGFMVGNKTLVSALARIKSYHDYGTFTPLQVAALAALEAPQECVDEAVRTYQSRRDVLAKGLQD